MSNSENRLIDRLFGGEVIVLPPTRQSLALVDATKEVIGEAPCDNELRQKLNAMPDAALADLTVGLKEKVLQDSSIQAHMHTLVRSSGSGLFSGEVLLADSVRLRVIPGGREAAFYKASAFAAHRDSWYANSRAQINWWIPLHDVDDSQSVLFYPSFFDRPIANDSEQFDYATWRNEVGFGKSQLNRGGFYPRATQPIEPDEPRFAICAEKGSIVLFSAAHLHQTVINKEESVRISLDFRTVDPLHESEGIGAPDLDNRSRGSATIDYRPIHKSARTFLEAFREIVQAYPENLAILENGELETSYKDLDARARRLGARLREAVLDDGAKTSAVGIYIEKSTEYVVALLSIWYAGCAFVPLSSNLPVERLEYIVAECAMKYALITGDQSDQAEKLESLGLKPIVVDMTEPISDGVEALPVVSTELSDLAYIIFTSGSTGRPKGVMVEHSAIVSFLKDQIEAFELDSRSRSLFYLSTNFDASVSDIGTALLSGATLLIEDSESLLIDDGFYELLARRRVSYMDIPPSILKLMTPDKMPDSLKTIVIGGEVCPVKTVRQWAAHGGIRLVNVYGPTEATVCTSLTVCSAEHWHRPLIGSPMTDVEYLVVDENLEAVHPGDSGELLIAGPCLARGYLNQPELTASRFIRHDGRRWYRTSDRIKVHENGDLEFLGRIDRQVKVRGMLVEPEEIEARIKEHPQVARVAVLKRKALAEEGGGRELLIAFIEPLSMTEIEINSLSRSIKEQIQKTLPSWLHPNRLEFLEALPHTVTGKIDLALLATMPLSAGDESSAWDQELSTIEEKALQVILSVLKLDFVSPEDNFFDLGGDSFSALELSLLAGDNGLSISPAAVYQNPRIADLLANLKDAAGASSMEASFLRKEVRDRLASLEGLAPHTDGTRRKAESILLTGTTGFLGSRLLKELLADPDIKRVYCLVRAKDEAAAVERIEAALLKQGLPTLSAGEQERIYPLLGDLGKPGLGLAEDHWERLSFDIDSIYHCGALVNMVLPYDDLKKVNLDSTVEIARLALSGRPKHLHYASTLSVFVATDKNTGVVYESDRLDRTEQVYGGYAQSKWAAERFLLSLQSRYPAISIFRLGLIVGDSEAGRASEGDFLSMFVRGLRALQVVPSEVAELALDLTPVDYAARAMARLSLSDQASGTGLVYHIANMESLKLDLLARCLVSVHSEVKLVPPEEFLLRVKRLRDAGAGVASEETAAVMALCRVICPEAGAENELFESLRTMDLFQATAIEFDQENTQKGLRSTSICCPYPSKELVSMLIEAALKEPDSASLARYISEKES